MTPDSWGVSLDAINASMTAAYQDFMAAMLRLRDLPIEQTGRAGRAERARVINQALTAVTAMNRAMLLGALIRERVFGPEGPPPCPDNSDAARQAAMEEMTTITVRVLLPVLGDDHYPCRALSTDLRRWLSGLKSEVYRPIGRRDPRSLDPARLDEREVAVLLFRLTAAARGIKDEALLKQTRGAPGYSTFRSNWQPPVPLERRNHMGVCGEHWQAAKARGEADPLPWPDPAGRRLSTSEAKALRAFEEGEPTLERLFALVQGVGRYKGLGRKHQRKPRR